MAKIPTSVRVGPFRYRILFDSDIVNRDRCGEISYQALTIRIMSQMAAERVAEVLMHEVLHAVWHIGLEPEGEYKAEDVVSRLSPNLLTALRDNPDLVAFFENPED